MNELMKRRRAMLGARIPIYQIRNVVVQAGTGISTGQAVLKAGKAVTILFDFTVTQNPSVEYGLGSIYKLLQMGTTREICIGKYSTGDSNLALWWMPSSNADQSVLTGVRSEAGRKRIAITHNANSGVLQVYAKIDNGNTLSFTKTKTFSATNAILSAGYYTNDSATVRSGLPPGIVNNLAIYDAVLSDQEIADFFT